MVIGREQSFLPPRYFVLVGGLTYNEEWDETAKLYSDSKVKNNDQ